MPERKDEYYPEDSKWNEAIDIAEKRNEAIVEELELMKISRHFVDKACCGDFSLAFDLAQRKIDNLIQELQPPEQSPKGEENK